MQQAHRKQTPIILFFFKNNVTSFYRSRFQTNNLLYRSSWLLWNFYFFRNVLLAFAITARRWRLCCATCNLILLLNTDMSKPMGLLFQEKFFFLMVVLDFLFPIVYFFETFLLTQSIFRSRSVGSYIWCVWGK